jgi:RimJ/RimL family protein N-acetyltransferase
VLLRFDRASPKYTRDNFRDSDNVGTSLNGNLVDDPLPYVTGRKNRDESSDLLKWQGPVEKVNDPVVVFATERFSAHQWDPDNHAEGAFAMYGDPDVVRYIGNVLVSNIDAQRDRLRVLKDRWASFGGRYGSWPVFERATGELVGVVLLKPLPLSGTNLTTFSADIEIGWHVAKRHWGRGIATEMGWALLQHGFEVLDLELLHAVVDPLNAASQRVAEKIGMRRMGQTRAYYDQELEHFEMNREEWQHAH